jgi:hypothetical protein
VALRFPRIKRWRKDKKVTEADTLDSIRSLVQSNIEINTKGPKTDEDGNLLLFE